MPDKVIKQYNPDSGEWFPYGGPESDNPDIRTRAMYFFHGVSSLGDVVDNLSIKFTNQITTGGGSVSPDTQSWPLTDGPLNIRDRYSNNDTCYRYRFNSSSQEPSRVRVGIWKPTELAGGGFDTADVALYNRYVDALKTIFGPETESIQLDTVEISSGSFWTPGENVSNVLPFEGVALPVFDDTKGVDRSAQNDYNIDIRSNDEGLNIIQKTINLHNTDGIWRLPDESIGAGNPGGVETGVIQWNAVSSGGESQILSGQFIVGDVEDYNNGDYLLLEATDGQSHFHNRVVFVVDSTLETTEGTPVIEIQLLDDGGFLPEDPESFNITKLTNAPKLKVTYRVPENTGSSIVVTDDVEDVN